MVLITVVLLSCGLNSKVVLLSSGLNNGILLYVFRHYADREGLNQPEHQFFLFLFFFIWVLRPFQEYFTYIKPIVHRRWAKTGEPGEKPPDHP